MKKLTALIPALLLLFALSACGRTDSPASGSDLPAAPLPASDGDLSAQTAPASAGLANPMVEYDTPEELNDLTGGKLCIPPVMGVSDRTCYLYTPNNMAELQYTLNGMPYAFRFCAALDRDISGLYIDGASAFAGTRPTADIQYAESADAKVARWATVDGQYVLLVIDGGALETEQLLSAAKELQSLTVSDRNG